MYFMNIRCERLIKVAVAQWLRAFCPVSERSVADPGSDLRGGRGLCQRKGGGFKVEGKVFFSVF